MSRYVASRWVISKNLIFPQEVFVEKFHVRTRKRRFPLFWNFSEESIPLTKVASIKIRKGLLFSDVTIENSGGDYPITISGFSNRIARNFRDDLEGRERQMLQGGKKPNWAEKTSENPSEKPDELIDIDDGFSSNEEYEVTHHQVD